MNKQEAFLSEACLLFLSPCYPRESGQRAVHHWGCGCWQLGPAGRLWCQGGGGILSQKRCMVTPAICAGSALKAPRRRAHSEDFLYENFLCELVGPIGGWFGC